MNVNDFNVPENLYYTREHEWALLEKSGCVRIGITDYAQKMLHEVVFVGVPKKGSEIKQMESLGTVESVKAVSEVYSPVSGKVVEVNQELTTSPEMVSQDPYGKGWLILVRPTNIQAELKELLTAKEYAEHLKRLA